MSEINNISNYYNYIRPGVGEKKVCKEDNCMSEEFKKMIHEIVDAKSHDEIEQILDKAVNNGDVEQLEDLMSYRCGDYLIVDMLRRSGENYANTLKMLNSRFPLEIFPKYVASKNIDDYTILIEKIPGMNGKDLVPYNKGHEQIDEKTKMSAYKDVQKLVKAGLICQNMLRGDYAWFIVPETKSLMVPQWNSLRPVGQNERAEILNTVYKSLFNQQDT